jgi:3-methyl-2-oxobutanoate hydroxymethyltransferase
MYLSSPPSQTAQERETAPKIRGSKGSRKLVMITAYDVAMARLVDEAGVDIVLVGDSLGMVFQGGANTLAVTVEDICYHGRAVARGLTKAHLVGDMPFMSYQVSPEQAVASAGRLVKEGGFEAVKVEGGEAFAEHVRRIVAAGIPVMGHVGLMPQSVHALGGFRVQGKTEAQAEAILRDAKAIEAAGAYSIVLEAVPAALAQKVTRTATIPTIGIGAGAGCDGQVLVLNDLLGLGRGHVPSFAKTYAKLGDAVVEAVDAYAREVRSGAFPPARSPKLVT